jgi:hypothetical protein
MENMENDGNLNMARYSQESRRKLKKDAKEASPRNSHAKTTRLKAQCMQKTYLANKGNSRDAHVMEEERH